MPNAVDVTPGRWSDLVVIFDDDSYSAVWGRFDNWHYKDLGVRWNGSEGTLGYPNGFGRPQWHVEYQPLQVSIMLGMKERLLLNGTPQQIDDYLKPLNTAIEEAIEDAQKRRQESDEKAPASE